MFAVSINCVDALTSSFSSLHMISLANLDFALIFGP
jgi:hypothetical protein